MSRRRWLASIAAISAASVFAGCSRGAPHPNGGLRSASLRGSNVLLITIDTLRADRVGAYGEAHRRGGTAKAGESALTPTLDALAARGVRFTTAHAHVPLTLPAHTSILTGLIPPTHGVRTNGSTALSSETPTMAVRLRETGYRTGAFVGAFVLDARFGLNSGFDTYDDRVGSDTGPITFAFAERTADRVVQAAGDWILETSRIATPESLIPNPGSLVPWFAWVHLFDPHAPYHAPEARVSDPYDNEVAFADAQIGRLIDRLRSAGQIDRTLVVVLADHGESLGEHGEATHGLFAYEATLRIPLILAGPAIQPQVCETPASQSDVMPTILDLLGVAAPRVDGRSLLPAIRGESAAAPVIYFEALDSYVTRNWAPLTGVIEDGWKYIDLPDPELYDLARDPGERTNEAGLDRTRASALRQHLARWPAPTTALTGRRTVPLDPDAAARLRALGYVAAPGSTARRSQFTASDDPKHLIDVDRRYQRALTATGEGHLQEAITLLRSVIADRSDFAVAYTTLASVLIEAGRPGDAIPVLEQASSRGLETPDTLTRLASAYLAKGDPARAAAVLEAVVARGEGGPEALNTLGAALSQTGHIDRARRLFLQVVQQSPESATTWTNLGLLEMSAHRNREAAKAFERAVSADPRLGQAWQGLGAARAGFDVAGAIDAWRRAEQFLPRDYDLLFNLAVVLREAGRTDEARPYIERFIREAPPDRYGPDIVRFRQWLGGR